MPCDGEAVTVTCDPGGNAAACSSALESGISSYRASATSDFSAARCSSVRPDARRRFQNRKLM